MSIYAIEDEKSGWKFVEPGVMGHFCRPNHRNPLWRMFTYAGPELVEGCRCRRLAEGIGERRVKFFESSGSRGYQSTFEVEI